MRHNPNLSEVVEENWLHVIPLRNGMLRLRIEDIEANTFTPWVDLTKEECASSIFPLVGGKRETVGISGGREEYLIRVDDEEALEATLYPSGEELSASMKSIVWLKP